MNKLCAGRLVEKTADLTILRQFKFDIIIFQSDYFIRLIYQIVRPPFIFCDKKSAAIVGGSIAMNEPAR
jgi:hypothetical protein